MKLFINEYYKKTFTCQTTRPFQVVMLTACRRLQTPHYSVCILHHGFSVDPCQLSEISHPQQNYSNSCNQITGSQNTERSFYAKIISLMNEVIATPDVYVLKRTRNRYTVLQSCNNMHIEIQLFICKQNNGMHDVFITPSIKKNTQVLLA